MEESNFNPDHAEVGLLLRIGGYLHRLNDSAANAVSIAVASIAWNLSHSQECSSNPITPKDPNLSREYVLERLDQWYFDKFRRNYTQAVADDLSSKTKEYIKSAASFQSNLAGWLGAVDQMDSVESRLVNSKNLFTGHYSTIVESGIERGVIENLDLATLPEGFKEEYIDPVIQHSRKMKAFVDLVRTSVPTEKPSDFKSTLSDSDIDNKYVESFGNAKGLSDFWIRFAQLVLIAYDLDLRSGLKTQEEYCASTNYVKILGFQHPLIQQALFSDLDKR